MNWATVSQRLLSTCSNWWHVDALTCVGDAAITATDALGLPHCTANERYCVDGEQHRTDDLVRQMMSQGRYALLMRPQIFVSLADEQRDVAESAFCAAMAYVPAGDVFVESWRCDQTDEDCTTQLGRRAETESMYLDCLAVTNQQYQMFVECGGYEQESLWHSSVWPRVPELTDQTGCVAPRFWSKRRYPTGEAQHPVAGVSWFEANAYARWVGKRLPTDAEWVKTACWPIDADNRELLQRQYPWGQAMELARCNLWASQTGATVPVSEFPAGASVNGVQQLIGNVWEWTANDLTISALEGDIHFDQPLKSLRGGSFDTYFESQVSGQLQSGDDPLARRRNIGFRCAISECDVAEVSH